MPGTSQPAQTDEQLEAAFIGEAPLLDSTVTLVEYDPQWPQLYQREAGRIRGALGDVVVLLEHVGSTSVPGLPAKPVVDILLEVPDSADEGAYVPALEAAGYRLVIREPDWEQHRLFKGPDTDINLHVHSPGNGQTERYLLFRDWLRTHPAELALYLAKKRELAARTWRYMQHYADAKGEVIEEIVGRARAAQGPPAARPSEPAHREHAPGARQYDGFSAAYAKHTGSSAANAYYDRPAIAGLAGALAGQRVLDVGCAAGHLSALLAGRGADVLGLDISESLISLARKEFGAVARFEQADVTEPLSFADGSFDLITASLVLHYLEDWGPVLAQFRRVLRPGGALVFSVHHPGEDWHWFDRGNYFERELLEDEWELDGHRQPVRFYRRPLSWTFGAVRDAGFTVDRLEEPMPVAGVDAADPRMAGLLRTRPRFLYFRCLAG
ncbi:GrpB family protein [Amycolatopsis sp. PS_44_ISF1]|uniref:GrpB family protein n=1 Tax=Amycolatopsis sp. PS_44_ISF1 TaxID=2974917 RepID=UPI0028DEAE9F|nr:GrpB family protein [Amycolatopsis sp. PS_44_ISF1]MDT8914026.1 GrpB family protein [Amycolatopsis sp. PS_44_ISF1]